MIKQAKAYHSIVFPNHSGVATIPPAAAPAHELLVDKIAKRFRIFKADREFIKVYLSPYSIVAKYKGAELLRILY